MVNEAAGTVERLMRLRAQFLAAVIIWQPFIPSPGWSGRILGVIVPVEVLETPHPVETLKAAYSAAVLPAAEPNRRSM
jgi:hypothetical protein